MYLTSLLANIQIKSYNYIFIHFIAGKCPFVIFLEVDALTHSLIPSAHVTLTSVPGTNIKYLDIRRLNKAHTAL